MNLGGNCSLTVRLLTIHRCSASCGSVQFHISNENLKQSLKLGARLWYFCSLWAKPFFPRSLTVWFRIPPERVGIGWALPACCVAASKPAWHSWAMSTSGNPQMTAHPLASLRVLWVERFFLMSSGLESWKRWSTVKFPHSWPCDVFKLSPLVRMQSSRTWNPWLVQGTL